MPKLEIVECDIEDIMVATALMLKSAGPQGMECQQVYRVLGHVLPMEGYAAMLKAMFLAGVLKHDSSVAPCRMVFVEMPDDLESLPPASKEVM